MFQYWDRNRKSDSKTCTPSGVNVIWNINVTIYQGCCKRESHAGVGSVSAAVMTISPSTLSKPRLFGNHVLGGVSGTSLHLELLGPERCALRRDSQGYWCPQDPGYSFFIYSWQGLTFLFSKYYLAWDNYFRVLLKHIFKNPNYYVLWPPEPNEIECFFHFKALPDKKSQCYY